MSNEALNDTDADAELVSRAKDGDAAALNELVARHHAAVFRVALSIVSDEESAADIAQDTFVKAMRGLANFRGDSSFRTWLFAIARNEARGHLRKGSRRREIPLDDAPPAAANAADPMDRIERESRACQLKSALERLPEKQRMAVSLRVYEGLGFREVGGVIGSSEGAARVNYHHGVKRLRELLNDG